MFEELAHSAIHSAKLFEILSKDPRLFDVTGILEAQPSMFLVETHRRNDRTHAALSYRLLGPPDFWLGLGWKLRHKLFFLGPHFDPCNRKLRKVVNSVTQFLR